MLRTLINEQFKVKYPLYEEKDNQDTEKMHAIALELILTEFSCRVIEPKEYRAWEKRMNTSSHQRMSPASQ